MDKYFSYTESKELIQIKKLIDVSELDEAEQLIKEFEEKGGHSLHDTVFSRLLKCELLIERGLNEDVFKLAEQIYKESLGLEKSLLSVDILLIMALSLLCLGQTDKAYVIIKQGEELLKTSTQELSAQYKQRNASIAHLKGWVYDQRGDVDQALEHFKHSLLLREEIGDKYEIADSLYDIAWIFMLRKGDFEIALKYAKQCITCAKESGKKSIIGGSLFCMALLYFLKGDLDRSIMYAERSLTNYNELNNLFMITRVLGLLGDGYLMRGEIDQSIKFYEHTLELFKKFNNKLIMASVLNSLSFCYMMKGELDRALECIEQSMALLFELKSGFSTLANNYHFLIQILIDKGDLKGAEKSLRDLEHLSNQLKDDHRVNSIYLLDKALLLKTSPRALNRGKAEEILKQLLEDEALAYYIKTAALLNLCELLLTELRITNETEVLEEIKPLLAQLIDLSERSQSFWVLGESYLLQAKLALISFNLEEARRFLTQGQEIAEKYGINSLAIKISNEHDELLKQLELWEKLKESKAPLTERMELSRLNEQMEGMVRRRISESPKLEAEQPVLFIIMGKNGNILLSNPFTADIAIDSAFFSEFLSSCNTFCDQILSESFDRVKFGQHTVLITALDSLSVCYMFQGQSYSARQKLLHFSETVKKDPNIMKMLEDVGNKKIEIKINEIPSLEELIYESFLSDPEQFQMPFKAYEGDGPFVFVSYSHTDRLQVYPIIDYLNKTGINIWYDEGISVSEDWKSSIVNNLERCSTFLVFITPRIIDSEYVRKEISFALKKKKPFFSVYLKETELPSKLEFEIGDIQFMKKYLMPEAEFYDKLNSMLKSIINI